MRQYLERWLAEAETELDAGVHIVTLEVPRVGRGGLAGTAQRTTRVSASRARARTRSAWRQTLDACAAAWGALLGQSRPMHVEARRHDDALRSKRRGIPCC
jgi:hypothetical protein